MTNPNKAELRRLAEAACITHSTFEENAKAQGGFIGVIDASIVLSLLDECDRKDAELSACKEHPGGCGYWREAARLREAERDAALAELAQCRADSADVWGLAQGRADTIDELRAELEACRKDADRLDWLTKKGAEEDPEQGDVRGYIDSAMSQEVGHD